MKACVICGRNITWTFWVCAGCEKEYDIENVPYRNWPEWVHELVRTSRREARAERREIPFSRLRFTEDCDLDPFDFITRS